MSKRARREPKSGSKSKSAGAASQRTLFGEAPLLVGEDSAAYEELHNLVCAVIKPIDVIDEIFIADFVFLEWEVLRWRRLKSSLIQARAVKALEWFLIEHFFDDPNLYSEKLVEHLTEILGENARTLADKCARNEADAVNKINELLVGSGLSVSDVRRWAREAKTREIVQRYVGREPDTVTLVDEFLTQAGESMQAFMADAHAQKLNDIERIDRLITIAESRRNTCLREIDRRRAILGETMRRAVQEIEESDFKLIEATPANRKNAA
jgi:hypothetical protein